MSQTDRWHPVRRPAARIPVLGVPVVGRLDLADAGVGGTGPLLQLERHGHLLLRGKRDQLVPPQVEVGHGNAVRRGQTHCRVRGGEAGVVPGLGQGVGHDRLVERPGIGEALTVSDDDPDADPLRLRRRQRLDIPVVDADGRVAGPPDVGLDLLPGGGAVDDRGRDLLEVRHQLCRRWSRP